MNCKLDFEKMTVKKKIVTFCEMKCKNGACREQLFDKRLLGHIFFGLTKHLQ